MQLSYNGAVWRQMADRARRLADQVVNPALKARISGMAAGFDALAERVEGMGIRRAARDGTPQENQQKTPPGERNR